MEHNFASHWFDVLNVLSLFNFENLLFAIYVSWFACALIALACFLVCVVLLCFALFDLLCSALLCLHWIGLFRTTWHCDVLHHLYRRVSC